MYGAVVDVVDVVAVVCDSRDSDSRDSLNRFFINGIRISNTRKKRLINGVCTHTHTKVK